MGARAEMGVMVRREVPAARAGAKPTTLRLAAMAVPVEKVGQVGLEVAELAGPRLALVMLRQRKSRTEQVPPPIHACRVFPEWVEWVARAPGA